MRRRSVIGVAAAIVVTIAVALFLSPVSWNGWDRYATAVGEQRAIELTDGSLVQLSAQSQLRVRFSDAGRDIRLVKGEALFTVRHDARLPFRVHAGNAVIQAIGTQFNVNRRTRDTAVAVIEGVVQVTDSVQPPERLKAGESAHVTNKGAIVGRSRVDATRVAAWRERRLVFQADTLEDMAQQFNRYNRTPKIRIDGEEIAQRRFTGVLDAVNPEALLNLLLEADDLVAVRQGSDLVIRKVEKNRR